MRGLFITIEGTEGVGKSTNVAFVREYIASHGIELVVTREPGGTPLAEEIRNLLLAPRSELVDPVAELLLIFAARAQHISEVIAPALARGAWVLSDRFTDATYAYQGFGRNLPLDVIQLLEGIVQNQLHPDKTILLDIDVHVGLERARSRGELDRFEQEDILFFESVRTGYKTRVEENPHRYSVVDAGHALARVQEDIKHVLDGLIAQAKS